AAEGRSWQPMAVILRGPMTDPAASAAPAKDLLQVAQAMAPRVRALAGETERARSLAPELAEAMRQAGLFRMLVPRSLGGLEVEPAVFARVIEELGAADGAAGWTVMVAATTGLLSAYLDPVAAAGIFGDPRMMA